MNKHESCCVLVTGVRNFVVCLHFQFLILKIYNAIQNPADGYVFLCVRFVLCADVYFMSIHTPTFNILHVWVFCLHGCAPSSRGPCCGQKRVLYALGLELQMVVSCSVGAENQVWKWTMMD